MKSVKVYELKETDLLIEDADNLNINQWCSNNVMFVQNSKELYSSSFTSVNVPIRKYISNGKEFYFAFDQKLDKVFKSSYGVDDIVKEAYFLKRKEGELKVSISEKKNQIKTLEIRINHLISTNNELSESLTKTQYDLSNNKDKLFSANVKLTIIENMSLWQRIVFLFTGRTT